MIDYAVGLSDASLMLGVSLYKVKQLISRGEMPSIQTGKGYHKVLKSEILKVLKSKESVAKQQRETLVEKLPTDTKVFPSQIFINISDEMHLQLKKVSRQQNKTMSDLIRQAVDDYLAKQPYVEEYLSRNCS